MNRTAIWFAVAAFAAVAPGPSTAAEPASAAHFEAGSSDLSAQARRRATRLRVTPGRLLYRDCSFRLAQEFRPSGTVVVPRMRCWWVRG
jgi:hypothetical protein